MAQRLLMNLDQLGVVKNIPLFSGLTAEEKDNLLKGGGVYAYSAKKHLFRQDDPVIFLYILCNGIVQECRNTSDGHEVTVNIYRAGDVFCKTSMFLNDIVHPTNTIAVGDVDVMELPIEKFKENLLKYESVATHLFSSLAQFALMKQIEVEQRATMTAAQILAVFLQKTCDSYGLDPRGFTLPYKKSLIASRLGMKLETLSRALPRLKEYGITVKGSHVSFAQPQTAPDNIVTFPAVSKNSISSQMGRQ
jgi:CRP-like cAMP-binding protein